MSFVRSFYDIAGWISGLERRVSALERLEPIRIVAKYRTNAGQSIANSTTTIIDFEDQDYDTHSAVTTGAAWKFTAPINGYYLVVTSILFDATTTWAENEIISLYFYVDGTETDRSGYMTGLDSSGGTTNKASWGSTVVYLAQSSYMDVRVRQNSGGALTLYSSTDNHNYVAITRVG